MSNLILLAVLGCVCTALGAVPEDEITDLPGLTFKPNFKSYSGYLKASGTKKLHYWFVESQSSPASDPLVLWLNGGPGCSSVLGLLTEHGPYQINEDGSTLRANNFSWNRNANMLYLEAPAGVGYSYSDDKNYTTSDDEVSQDNYYAIVSFLSKYKEYASNDFYITGESYGGIYVPTLSVRVMKDSSINFKGLAIGNGALDFKMLAESIVTFAYGHGLIGNTLMMSLFNNCCKKSTAIYPDCNFYDTKDPECQKDVGEVQGVISTLNVYDLYGECYPTQITESNKTHIIRPLDVMFHKNPFINAERMKILSSVPHENIAEVPPCIDGTPATKYMNSASVRKALHIPSALPEWAMCSGVVGAGYVRQYDNMRDQMMQILGSKKLRVLVYNGDTDMACNFLGDEWFVDSLGQPLVKPRQEWLYTAEDKTTQVAGFVKQFENINFVTIRGAGHMVPEDKPRPAFDMFTRFLKNQPY